MLHPSTRASVAIVVAALATVLHHVNGGAYVLSPTSRPLLYSAVYQNESFVKFENCPGCLNSGGPEEVKARGIANTNGGLIAQYGDGEWPHLAAFMNGEVCDNGNFFERNQIAVRHGICGDPKQFALESTNAYSTPPSEWSTVETFQEGGVMDITVVITRHLRGHLEFFVCSSSDLIHDLLKQECFNMNPLTRVEGDSINSPIDPDFEGRYYVDPPCEGAGGPVVLPDGAQHGQVMSMQYQLPQGLTCEHCVLQMVYYTGNTCKHIGYDEFEPSSWPSSCAPDKEDWIDVDRWMCGMDGAYPEEFWSCSDIAITAYDASDQPPAPEEAETPAPTSATEGVTPAPVAETTGTTSRGTPAPPSAETTPLPARTVEPTTGETMGAPYHSEVESPGNDRDDPSITSTGTSAAGEGCTDLIDNYGQCGGNGPSAPDCCGEGFKCVATSDRYSQCRPVAKEVSQCADELEQCGGINWTGTTCCAAGLACTEWNKYWSSCRYI